MDKTKQWCAHDQCYILSELKFKTAECLSERKAFTGKLPVETGCHTFICLRHLLAGNSFFHFS